MAVHVVPQARCGDPPGYPAGYPAGWARIAMCTDEENVQVVTACQRQPIVAVVLMRAPIDARRPSIRSGCGCDVMWYHNHTYTHTALPTSGGGIAGGYLGKGKVAEGLTTPGFPRETTLRRLSCIFLRN